MRRKALDISFSKRTSAREPAAPPREDRVREQREARVAPADLVFQLVDPGLEIAKAHGVRRAIHRGLRLGRAGRGARGSCGRRGSSRRRGGGAAITTRRRGRRRCRRRCGRTGVRCGRGRGSRIRPLAPPLFERRLRGTRRRTREKRDPSWRDVACWTPSARLSGIRRALAPKRASTAGTRGAAPTNGMRRDQGRTECSGAFVPLATTPITSGGPRPARELALKQPRSHASFCASIDLLSSRLAKPSGTRAPLAERRRGSRALRRVAIQGPSARALP